MSRRNTPISFQRQHQWTADALFETAVCKPRKTFVILKLLQENIWARIISYPAIKTLEYSPNNNPRCQKNYPNNSNPEDGE
jgi:hypothetical protein